MSSPAIYEFNDQKVRTVIMNDEPWFIAKDLFKILGISGSHALEKLDADEKGVNNLHTLGGIQKVNVVSESGLYLLTILSRKPEAKKFRRWVTSEVLPQIKRTGGYINPAATIEQITNLQVQLHNQLIESKHYKMLYESAKQAEDIWKARAEYGSISKANQLPKMLKRRGAWVADPRYRQSIELNFEQGTFKFIENGK